MFRLSGLFSILLAVLCGSMLFWTSQSVQRAEQKLSEVSHYKANEGETLRVLSAEWDYLNRPERLEAIAKDNFDMDAVATDESSIVNEVQYIPEPVIPVVPKMKPKNLMQYVSTQKEGGAAIQNAAPQKTIEKVEKKKFDQLLQDLSEGHQ